MFLFLLVLLDCYGAHKSIKDAWKCDVCVNKKNPAASYVSYYFIPLVF